MIFRKGLCHTTYIKKLPDHCVKASFKTGVELLRLKQGRRKWSIDNVEIINGLPLFVYSKSTGRYWKRTLDLSHHIAPYRHFIAQGILYIHFDDKWLKWLHMERENEGLGYYQYNRLRELLFLNEILDKHKDEQGYLIKKRNLSEQIISIKNN